MCISFFHQPSLMLFPRFPRQYSRQISSCPVFWGKPLFPGELSAVTRSHTLASASLRDPCETRTRCPPKTAGQQRDSLQQMHFQTGRFFSGTAISTQTSLKRAMFYEILSLFLYCSCLGLSYVGVHASNEHCRPLKMSPTDYSGSLQASGKINEGDQ